MQANQQHVMVMLGTKYYACCAYIPVLASQNWQEHVGI